MDRRMFLAASAGGALAMAGGGSAFAAERSLPPLQVPVGYCIGLRSPKPTIDRLDDVRAAGFDYIELSSAEVARLPEADYVALADKLRRTGVRTPVANFFLPNDMRVVGPQSDPAAQTAYVEKTLARLRPLGVQIVVWGNVTGRQPPPGFAADDAFRQCADFCRRIAPIAKANGIVVAIEPVARTDDEIKSAAPRFLNTAGGVLTLVKTINDPQIQMIVDFFHLATEREDPNIILQANGHIRHLHIADPVGRGFPLKLVDDDYAPFFNNLRRIGYKGRISVEAFSTNFEIEAPQAIAVLKKAFTAPTVA